MKKIVVACDSFKGSLSSIEIANHVEAGIKKVLSTCEVIKLPVADGGEGTVEAILYGKNGKFKSCLVHDPLMNQITAGYVILEDGETAVIEIAAASGLTLVPQEKRNPMLTTTYGTGELIKDALLSGCRRFIIGVGGSATNDAGTGILQALGFRFLDKNGYELGKGGRILEHISDIDASSVMAEALDSFFIIASDVTNPFFGPNGAAYIFAKQKGADEEMIEELDHGLKHFSNIINNKFRKDIGNIPGSGSGGGIGGGLISFLNAEIKPGIEVVLTALNFKEYIKGADLIITGEGKMDVQTLNGKAPAGVLKIAQEYGIPVIAIGGGIVEAEILNEKGFSAVFSIQPYPVSLHEAMDKDFAGINIQRLITQIIRAITCC